MSRQTEMVIALAVTGIVSVWGALASKAVRDGAHYGWYYLAGVGGISTWAWMARRSPWNLLVSSILWDVIYNTCWVLTTIMWLGEASTRGQVIGAIIVIIGLAAMNL